LPAYLNLLSSILSSRFKGCTTFSESGGNHLDSHLRLPQELQQAQETPHT
jgi:hypothetical protein